MAAGTLSLGGVSYDIVAQDKTGEGLDSARRNFVVTAGDIIKAIQSVADTLAGFDEKNATMNTNLGITSLTLGMNAEDLRGWSSELASASDPIMEMEGLIDDLARAGIRNHDQMISTAEGWDRFADAVRQPADTFTKTMIPAFNAFGINVQDVGQYSDLLAYTFNTTEVEATDFAMAIKRAGPELAAAGVNMQDLAAMMVILKDRGYDGRNMMNELTTAIGNTSDANKDGKISSDEVLASMNITNSELSTVKARTIAASQGYAEMAQTIVEKNVSAQQQYNNTIDNTVLGLGDLTGPITGAASLFTQSAGAISGIAVPAMMLFPETFAGIGASITGALGGAGGSIGGALAGIGGSLAAAIAAGLVLGLAGVFTLDKLGILDGLDKLGRDIESSDIGSRIMGTLQVVLAPIGSIGAGIIDLIRGDFDKIPEDMGRPFEMAKNNIMTSVGGLRDAISGAFGGIQLPNLGDLAGSVQGAFASFTGAFSQLQQQAATVMGQFWNVITGGITTVLGSAFYNAGVMIIQSLVNGIMGSVNSLISTVSSVGSSVMNAIGGGLGNVGKMLGFAEGGVVPGPVGAPVPAIVHGGETIIPVGGGGGTNVTIAPGAIVINGTGLSPSAIADEVMSRIARVTSDQATSRGY